MAFVGSCTENISPFSPLWPQLLAASDLPPAQKSVYRRHVLAFLRYCRQQHARASVPLVQQYLAEQPEASPIAREALRWWFRASRSAQLADRAGSRLEPPLACLDRGGADWERDAIAAMRTKGFLWRTEKAYRAWGQRFAAFLQPRSLYAADASDVARFLTELAVTQRASPSTQKQALNALAFVLQEALRRKLDPIDFERARPRRRMPVVLSIAECRQLFAALDGTARLMAELAYGAGLRLHELLRLRVQDLDVERGRLIVRAGKGDKDRVTVLPQRLGPALREHIERLRILHTEDRATGLPGVWLPEGLARKYQRAGETWEWQWLFVTGAP